MIKWWINIQHPWRGPKIIFISFNKKKILLKGCCTKEHKNSLILTDALKDVCILATSHICSLMICLYSVSLFKLVDSCYAKLMAIKICIYNGRHKTVNVSPAKNVFHTWSSVNCLHFTCQIFGSHGTCMIVVTGGIKPQNDCNPSLSTQVDWNQRSWPTSNPKLELIQVSTKNGPESSWQTVRTSEAGWSQICCTDDF